MDRNITDDARQIFALAQARGKARSYKHCVIDALRQVRDDRNPAQAAMPYGQALDFNPSNRSENIGQTLDIYGAISKLPHDEYLAVTNWLAAGCPARSSRGEHCRATLRDGLDMLKSYLRDYSPVS